MKYPKEKVKDILFKLNFELPKDYLNYIISNDGVVENHLNYIDLWPLDKLFQYNDECESFIYLPSYLIIGTNGGGTALAIKINTGEIFATEMIGMDENDVIKVANNFTEYLQYFKTKNLDYI
ncbi:MAG: SMI1/KNR4 family protein [Saprospiraceae bacterium]